MTAPTVLFACVHIAAVLAALLARPQSRDAAPVAAEAAPAEPVLVAD